MIDYAAIERDYHLKDIVEQALGPGERSGGWVRYRCPFHEDHSPSFIVGDKVCSCRAGCDMLGQEWANVITFVAAFYKLPGRKAAAEWLTGKQQPTSIEKQRQYQREQPPPDAPLPWWEVESAYQNKQVAEPFFTGRGLRASTMDSHWLGAKLLYPKMVDLPGYGAYKTYITRYAIPDIFNGKVRSIELRRDDAKARAMLRDGFIATDKLDAMRQKLAKTRPLDAVSDEELLDAFFGAKYVRVKGGIRKDLVFNLERLMQVQPDGDVLLRHYPYVLVHEGRIKAMAMEDACDDPAYGYPSVAAKAAHGLANVTIAVKEIVVVQDRDTSRKDLRTGQLVNAGEMIARNTLIASGRTLGVNARIILPPEGFRDADEVVRAGLAHEWMATHGLSPVKWKGA